MYDMYHYCRAFIKRMLEEAEHEPMQCDTQPETKCLVYHADASHVSNKYTFGSFSLNINTVHQCFLNIKQYNYYSR